LLCALVLAGLSACTRSADDDVIVRSVRTAIVGQRGAEQSLEYAGEVRARTQSVLGFRVGGKLVERKVDLGDRVKKGQVLARLDPEDLQLGREAAMAALAAAKANYQLAVADTKRFKDLLDQGFVSSAEFDRHETARIAAKAQLEQAKAQAGVQDNQTRYTELVADAPGVITAVDAEPGQVMSAGMPVVTLARDGPLDVVFNVPEDQVDWVKSLLGRRGAVHVRRWGRDEAIEATIREVAAAADPVTRTYIVKADVAAKALHLGQTATVSIQRRDGGSDYHLPLTALFEADGRSCVWRLDPQSMTVQRVPVQVASVSGDSAVIAQGVRGGDEIVTAGVHVLTQGQKVQRYHGTGLMPADDAASGH
jgi:RND family efflux transporter MFP subunit